MKSIREVVKELKVFERNEVPLEIKILGIATYIQTSSVRRLRKFSQKFTQSLTTQFTNG